ncbi:MAG: periplasmic divalent cation tolerance protein [Planctomycetota bacterium]|jgi:periplasmic divalent cation tolerance protein
MENVVVVLVTAPAGETGVALARGLVEAGVCACVNLVPGVLSVYRWKGEVCEEGEVLLVIKSTLSGLARLEAAVLEAHPYDTPEFVVLDPVHVEGEYAAWVVGKVGGSAARGSI